LRAYLYIRPTSVTTDATSGNPKVTFLLHLVGTGSTPATNIVTGNIAHDFPYPMPDPFELPLDYVTNDILASFNEMDPPETSPLDPITIVLDKQKVSEISDGKRLIFVYGFLQYRDIFSRDWAVRYCFFYDWESLTKTGNAIRCPWHNDRKQEQLRQILPEEMAKIIRERSTIMKVPSFTRNILKPPR
jgi:hypothetical protein